MKWIGSNHPQSLFAEVRPTSLHAWYGPVGIDIPLEREPDGRFTPSSIDRAAKALGELVPRGATTVAPRVYCAIGSRGVVFRRLSIPAAPDADLARLLGLQIETEFPVAPEQLAWGWCHLSSPVSVSQAQKSHGKLEVLVGAIKQELLEPHRSLFAAIDPDPRFTIGALDRLALIPNGSRPVMLLEIDARQSELLYVDAEGTPTIRSLPVGAETLIGSIQDRGSKHETAMAASTDRSLAESGPLPVLVEDGLQRLAQEILKRIPESARQVPLWVSGPIHLRDRVAQVLSRTHRTSEACRPLQFESGAGKTAANLGCSIPNGTSTSPLGPLPRVSLSHEPMVPVRQRLELPPKKWLVGAAVLVCLALAIPYAEALWHQPRLSQRIQVLKSGEPQLGIIDRKLSFLRYLDQNQAPHLDALFVIAQSAPQGARIETLNLNRQGEVSIGGFLRDLTQIGDFRLKLINSGFFSRVVMEDQSPTPDRQRINFRITAQWKDVVARETLILDPPAMTNTPASPSKLGATNALLASSTNSTSAATSAPPVNAGPIQTNATQIRTISP